MIWFCFYYFTDCIKNANFFIPMRKDWKQNWIEAIYSQLHSNGWNWKLVLFHNYKKNCLK